MAPDALKLKNQCIISGDFSVHEHLYVREICPVHITVKVMVTLKTNKYIGFRDNYAMINICI